MFGMSKWFSLKCVVIGPACVCGGFGCPVSAVVGTRASHLGDTDLIPVPGSI